MERINKYLASRGIASRRQVDDLIKRNSVLVNGQPATVGQKIDPINDRITVNGKNISSSQPDFVYLVLHKPAQVLSTTRDDRGRLTVIDLVKSSQRLYPVGRLDYFSTGLILLTNDGALALKLSHPRYHLPKTYLVTLRGKVSPAQFTKLRDGMVLDDGKTLPAEVVYFHESQVKTVLKMTIRQGKNRQIRRMCAALDLQLLALHRIAIGPILLGNLKESQTRPLSACELDQLRPL